MGGVVKNDQMKSYYPIPVAEKKCWSRVFFDLIDRSILCLSKNHTMGKGTLFVHRGTMGGPLLSTYLLHMLKDISPTFSQLMRREKKKKGGVKFVMMQAKSRRQVTFALIMMLAFVLLLDSGCTISH